MSPPPGPVEIPVYVVIPPRVLLLDVAGPMEVLRKANLEQDRLRFVVTYIGPSPCGSSSVGLHLTGISALPEHLPDGVLVVVSGSASVPWEVYQAPRKRTPSWRPRS